MADVEADHLSYQEVSHRVYWTMTRRCLTSAACQKPIGPSHGFSIVCFNFLVTATESKYD
ncbi:hypothetical protein COLO4_37942 [Corchorus olitorius]|uniref:Uncharacterized protein n=1 Tax=Corchorus olitorius TaxID=93759 RepID=A0A1R3FY41_9ROSI|nr:hypothetical protein COLO4_37942 [Corchorus olitorius]